MEPVQGKVLLASAPIGVIHQRVAERILKCLKATHKGITARHLDITDHVGPAARTLVLEGYRRLLKSFPGLWGVIYGDQDAGRALGALGDFDRYVDMVGFSAQLERFAPDIFLATHPFAAAPAAAYKRQGGRPLVLATLVTDFQVHPFWIRPETDLYLCAGDYQAGQLEALGIAPERIAKTGIPLLGERPQGDKAELKKGLGLEPESPVILFQAGGMRIHDVDRAVFQLGLLQQQMSLLINTEKDAELAAALRRAAARYEVKARMFGAADKLAEIMAVSDLAIGKAEVQNIAAALNFGVPFLAVEASAGQEAANGRFLEESGAGRIADVLELAAHVDLSLFHEEIHSRLVEGARKAGFSDAGERGCDALAYALTRREELLGREVAKEAPPSPEEGNAESHGGIEPLFEEIGDPSAAPPPAGARPGAARPRASQVFTSHRDRAVEEKFQQLTTEQELEALKKKLKEQ